MNDEATISVIIPALNEERDLERTLESCADPRAELIVVDGGSRDRTPEIARQCGASVYQTTGGRAVQMNFGARHSRGKCLLFLHADTRLPANYCSHVLETVGREGVVAGAFQLHIEAPGWPLRLIERAANLRSRVFQLPYGDQALFLTAQRFRAAGGYRELPIMEDFDLVRRLRTEGRILIAAPSVHTSARRWHTVGPWRTTLVNQRMVLRYLAGASPEQLADYYRSRNGSQ